MHYKLQSYLQKNSILQLYIGSSLYIALHRGAAIARTLYTNQSGGNAGMSLDEIMHQAATSGECELTKSTYFRLD